MCKFYLIIFGFFVVCMVNLEANEVEESCYLNGGMIDQNGYCDYDYRETFKFDDENLTMEDI